MLAAIDLTKRQAARVLAQAQRGRARVELEARAREGKIVGNFAGCEAGLLRIDLQEPGREGPVVGLVGAFCDVQTVLSGQLYLFSSCVVDAVENALPPRLLLAAPEAVQVANRRKFDRRSAQEQLDVRLWPAVATQPFVGTLVNIGPAGLCARLPLRDAEDFLLIDDEVRVRFQPARSGEAFELTATVCVKTPVDGEHIDVGLEFCVPRRGAAQQPGVDRLRMLLARDYTGPAKGGDA